MTVTPAGHHSAPPRYEARFVEGEWPTDPLRIQVLDGTGNPRDLTRYDGVSLDLPQGGSTVRTDTLLSFVDHTWSGPFRVVGRFTARVKLHLGDRTDHVPPVAIEVSPPP